MTLNLDGSFTYTPAINYNGSETFSYLADDGYGLTATATVTTVSYTHLTLPTTPYV